MGGLTNRFGKSCSFLRFSWYFDLKSMDTTLPAKSGSFRSQNGSGIIFGNSWKTSFFRFFFREFIGNSGFLELTPWAPSWSLDLPTFGNSIFRCFFLPNVIFQIFKESRGTVDFAVLWGCVLAGFKDYSLVVFLVFWCFFAKKRCSLQKRIRQRCGWICCPPGLPLIRSFVGWGPSGWPDGCVKSVRFLLNSF